MENYDDTAFINVGSGNEISIRDLAELVKTVIGYQGGLIWDKSKPDGTPRKFMESFAPVCPRLAAPDRSQNGHRSRL